MIDWFETGHAGLFDLAEDIGEKTNLAARRPGKVAELRAALAERRGDPQEARQRLREAHRLYTEMGATGHAKRLADELGL